MCGVVVCAVLGLFAHRHSYLSLEGVFRLGHLSVVAIVNRLRFYGHRAMYPRRTNTHTTIDLFAGFCLVIFFAVAFAITLH